MAPGGRVVKLRGSPDSSLPPGRPPSRPMTTLLFVLAQAPMLLLLAQDEEPASYGVAFLLLVLGLIGGVMATVRPDKREDEIKR